MSLMDRQQPLVEQERHLTVKVPPLIWSAALPDRVSRPLFVGPGSKGSKARHQHARDDDITRTDLCSKLAIATKTAKNIDLDSTG